MEDKKKQVMRFSEEELELMKATFADNDNLIKAMRKMFLQMPLNAVDLSVLTGRFKDKELNRVVRKEFLPELNADVPLGQQIDFWMTVPLNQLLPDVGAVHLKAIKVWTDYINQQLDVLKDVNKAGKEKIRLEDLTDMEGKGDEEIYINMMARNCIINGVEAQLRELVGLAGFKNETPEEKEERMEKDSTK